MDPKIRHIAFQGGLDEGQRRGRVWRGSRGSCPRTSCWTRPFCWPTGKGYREVGAPPHLLWDNTGTTPAKQTKRTGNYIDEEWLENMIILLREWPKTAKWDSTLLLVIFGCLYSYYCEVMEALTQIVVFAIFSRTNQWMIIIQCDQKKCEHV